MSFGSLLILAYWAVFTVRKGVKPKLNGRIRENAHERKLSAAASDEARIKKAGRIYKVLRACAWIYKAAGWIEAALLALIAAWIFFLIGAVITGSFVIFGYPV